MALIVKPDISKIWASTGSTAVPPDAKIATGWTYEMMPFEWENFLQNRNDVMLNHINQRGISEWDALTEYQAGRSYVTGSNGVVYFAVITNTGNDPTTDSGTNWVRAFPSITGGGASGTWSISVSGTSAGLATASGPITFNIASTEVARFTATGRLGIGVVAPSHLLDVQGTTNQVFIRARNSTTGVETKLGTSSDSGYVDAGNADLAFYRNGTEVGRFNGSNLGVGIAATNCRVHVFQSGLPVADPGVRVANGTISCSLTPGGIRTDGVTPVRFWVGAGEVGQFDINGNFAVGTSTTAISSSHKGMHLHNASGSQGTQIRLTNAGTGATSSDGSILSVNDSGGLTLWNFENQYLAFGTNNTERARLTAGGQLVVGRTSSLSGGMVEVGGAFVFNPSTSIPTLGVNGDTSFQRVSDTQFRILSRGGDGTTRYVNIPLDASGISLASDTSVDALKDIPSNPQTTSYTLALSDRGKSVDTTANVVVPANSVVAFPVGSVVMVTNTSGSNITISINTDTLRLAGTAGIGSRTLAQYGVATLRKITSTSWIITGAGVS